MRKGSELRVHTEALLDSLSIAEYEFGHTGGGHQFVQFRVTPKSKAIKVFFPSTASDNRAVKNHLAFIRRKIREAA